MSQYKVLPGPEAFLPPSAASMGNVLPDPGEAHIEGKVVPVDEAYEVAARKILAAKVPISELVFLINLSSCIIIFGLRLGESP